MSRFTDKTVIVTGAAGALGNGMVRRFAAEGANVVIGARREGQVTDLVDELGDDRVVFAKLDVTDERQWAGAVRKAEDAFGPVSILINNAARAIMGTIEELTVDEFREVSNTTSSACSSAFAPWPRRCGARAVVRS